ncbi:MAG: hypothetical protein HC802_02345 [Caldilineaceae bacterium]|nr:hypothetical protein [Caldilineaceae bacterium]
MSNIYLHMNAWREILARTFEGLTGQDNVSPKWLVNPATGRRLKLDRFYPDIGFAVRFVGLTAKGQGRQSDWDVLETQQRDQTRAELCRLNDVQLLLVDPLDEPTKQLDLLFRLLTRAHRVLLQSQRSEQERRQFASLLEAARTRATQLRTSVNKNPDQMMANLAESWRDREANVANSLSRPDPLRNGDATNVATNGRKQPSISIVPGQRVCHPHFGVGVITEVSGDGEDSVVAILFDGEQQRSFLTSLVQDKLELA